MDRTKRIRRVFREAALILTAMSMAMPPVEAFQGRGGGGGRPGGGGMARPGGGGGGMARPPGGGGGGGFSGGGFRGMSAPAARPSMPSMPQGRPAMPSMPQTRPSMPNMPQTRPGGAGNIGNQRPNIPNQPQTRPNIPGGNIGGMQRPNIPNQPQTRPNIPGGNIGGMQRPSMPNNMTRPGVVPGSPGGGNRPSIGSRPPWAGGTNSGTPGQRPVSPGIGGNRPIGGGATTLPGNASGLRPGAGGNLIGGPGSTKPAPGFRPDIGGNRPGAGGGGINRPGAGGATTLPGVIGGAGGINRPGQPNRPGAGGGGINKPGIGNGIGSGIDRPGFGGGGIRPGQPGSGVRPGLRPGQNGGGIRPGGNNNNIIGGNTNNNININNVNNRPIYNRPGYNGPGWWNGGGGGGYNRPGQNGGGIYRPGSGWWTNRPGGWGYDNGYGGYRPPYWNNHNNWHHGGWGWSNPIINNYYGGYGGYGGWGNNNWWAWGLGGFGLGYMTSSLMGWGMGSSLYNWGYSSYVNPYYSYVPQSTVIVQQQPNTVVVEQPTQTVVAQPYDYSRPLNTEAAQPARDVADPALTTFEKARESYIAGNYDAALTGVNKALEALPNDAVMHEFRGLTLFSLGRYGEASATIYPVLAVQPGMDWTSLSSLYSNVDTFTNQLRKLEGYRDANPDNPAARFLLSYLYLSMGYRDQAKIELGRLVQLQPNDTVSAGLLKVLNSTDESGNPIEQPPTAAASPATTAGGANAPAINPVAPPAEEAKNAPALDAIIGKLTAKPSATDTITLELGADKSFKWNVASGSQAPRGFNGKFEYEEGVLALLSDQNGQRLVGKLSVEPNNQIRFKVVDSPASDPGLLFSK